MAHRLALAAVVAALLVPADSLAQSEAKPAAPTLTKEEVTELSGLTVTVKKPDPTPLSGVTVAARRSTPVSELTVTAPKCPAPQTPAAADATPPKLISTYPAEGSTVRGGIIILRLTFDRPMTCVGLLDNRKDYPNPCPAPLTNPLFSRDRRTFLTVCVVDAIPPGYPPSAAYNPAAYGKPYGLVLDKFTSLSGQPLKPSNLAFYISPNSTAVRTVKEAMAQDRFLRDAQKAAEQTR